MFTPCFSLKSKREKPAATSEERVEGTLYFYIFIPRERPELELNFDMIHVVLLLIMEIR